MSRRASSAPTTDSTKIKPFSIFLSASLLKRKMPMLSMTLVAMPI